MGLVGSHPPVTLIAWNGRALPDSGSLIHHHKQVAAPPYGSMVVG